ncbi:hypothetical protein D3C83_105140 [compost metagenome]
MHRLGRLAYRHHHVREIDLLRHRQLLAAETIVRRREFDRQGVDFRHPRRVDPVDRQLETGAQPLLLIFGDVHAEFA